MIRLHGFHRSSATYRVRIALHLKGLEFECVEHDLVRGDHRLPAFAQVNPQALVPALEIDGLVLTQSLAIIEYLDEVYPYSLLLPSDPGGRARVRALFQVIGADTHHVTTLRVGHYLRAHLGAEERDVRAWQHHWLNESFTAVEKLLGNSALTGRFAHGDRPTLADIALVPQVYAAQRQGVSIDKWPQLARVVDSALAEPAFMRAHPQASPRFIPY